MHLLKTEHAYQGQWKVDTLMGNLLCWIQTCTYIYHSDNLCFGCRKVTHASNKDSFVQLFLHLSLHAVDTYNDLNEYKQH